MQALVNLNKHKHNLFTKPNNISNNFVYNLVLIMLTTKVNNSLSLIWKTDDIRITREAWQ